MRIARRAALVLALLLSPAGPHAGPNEDGAERKWARECEHKNKEACEDLTKLRSGRTYDQIFDERLMAMCAAGERSACVVYCVKDASSRQCLEKTGRASGATWYQDSDRNTTYNRDGTRRAIPVTCRGIPLAASESWVDVVCAGEPSSCRHDRDPARRFATLDAAASDACEMALASHRDRPNRRKGPTAPPAGRLP
jgi:hypothetical protein